MIIRKIEIILISTKNNQTHLENINLKNIIFKNDNIGYLFFMPWHSGLHIPDTFLLLFNKYRCS